MERMVLDAARVTTSFGAEDSLAIPVRVLHRRARRRRRLGLAGAAIAVVLLALLLLALRKRAPEPRYRLDPVARRTIASMVEATGFLDVETRVEVPAPRAAQLQRVLVRQGDEVKAGDL